MPTITFQRSIPGFEALSSDFFVELQDAPILSHSLTALIISASDFRNDRLSFYRTGLTYLLQGGEAVGVTGGSVTRIVYDNPTLGETYFNWTGLNVSAPTFVTCVRTGNWSALNALMFNTSDTYNLINGSGARLWW